MNIFKKTVCIVSAVMMMVFSSIVLAQDTPSKETSASQAPNQVIEALGNDVLSFLKANAALLESEPKAFFDQIEVIISPALNLEYIAKKVMGAYWGKATPEQRVRFQDVFARSMIVTYGKGMANYTDLEINILPPTKPVPESGGFVVVQEITTTGAPEKVVYFMGKRPGDRWQVINVIYEGVNLRDTSQGQFAQLASEKKGDIEAVIANWKSAE